MHDTAHSIGRQFFETYFAVPPAEILEVGSFDVNGSLRDCAPGGGIYTGVDISPGPGVDIVLEDPHSLPFADDRFDAIVSSSCFEHDPMFWVTFVEVVRVAKTGGIIYINAPSNGPYHAYPFDYWRFYPDAALSLVKWAKHNGREIELIESFIAKRRGDLWNDCVMVFRKGEGGNAIYRRIVDELPGSYNIRRSASGGLENMTEFSEDMLLLDEAKARLGASEREVARLTLELRAVQAKLETLAAGNGAVNDAELTPDVLRQIYLRRPGADYGRDAEEVVDLLVRAGLGMEKLANPYPPIVWKKTAAAATELKAWIKQNPKATAEVRATQARIVMTNH